MEETKRPVEERGVKLAERKGKWKEGPGALKRRRGSVGKLRTATGATGPRAPRWAEGIRRKTARYRQAACEGLHTAAKLQRGIGK